jgi:hypothetical protein
MSNNILYIAFFFFLILLINWFIGQKYVFYFLLLVLAGSLIYNVNNFKITTPKFLK